MSVVPVVIAVTSEVAVHWMSAGTSPATDPSNTSTAAKVFLTLTPTAPVLGVSGRTTQAEELTEQTPAPTAAVIWPTEGVFCPKAFAENRIRKRMGVSFFIVITMLKCSEP